MAEAAHISHRAGGGELISTTIDWGRAVTAGFVATVVITISMALFGMNIMKSLGTMMVGVNAGAGAQYALGGLIHLMIGIGYGIVYAALFAPIRGWSTLMKGAVFGLAITAIALAAMPVMAAMMGAGGASNPCNPCGAQMGSTMQGTPCNPCGAKMDGTTAGNPCNPCGARMGETTQGNPCNPCGAEMKTTPQGNPCNPCAAKTSQNPCNPCAANPCNVAGAGNPCNPCGGSGASPYSGLVSLVNHLIYGLTLALVYGRAGVAGASG